MLLQEPRLVGYPPAVKCEDLTPALVEEFVNDLLMARCFMCQERGVPASNALGGAAWRLTLCQGCCLELYRAKQSRNNLKIQSIFLLSESAVADSDFQLPQLYKSVCKANNRSFLVFLRRKHQLLLRQLEEEALVALWNGVSLNTLA